jgi:hypothetical protein
MLKFTTREAGDRFSAAVIALVRGRYPDALAHRSLRRRFSRFATVSF